jgi:hypothetical protein
MTIFVGKTSRRDRLVYKATAEGYPGYEGLGVTDTEAVGNLILFLASHGKADIEVHRP